MPDEDVAGELETASDLVDEEADSGDADGSDSSFFDSFVDTGADDPPEPEGDSEPPADTTETAEPAPKFVFAGREYETAEAAEQAYKSLEGRFRGVSQSLADREARINQWERWYEYERSQGNFGGKPAQPTPQQGQAGPTGSAGPTAEQKAAEPWLEAVNWKNVESYAKAGDYASAMKLMLLGVQDHYANERKAYEDRVEQRFAEVMRPHQEQLQREQAVSEAKNFLHSSVTRVDADGEPYFPELYEGHEKFDAEYAAAFVSTWKELLYSNPHMAMDSTGHGLKYVKSVVDSAWREYQENKGKTATAAARQGAQAVTRDAQGKFQKGSKANAEVGRAGVAAAGVANTGPAKSLSEAETIRAGIKNAGRGKSEDSFQKLMGIA